MNLLDVAKKALSQFATAVENGSKGPSGNERTYAVNAVNAESIGANQSKQPSGGNRTYAVNAVNPESPGTVINGRWFATGFEGLTTPFDETSDVTSNPPLGARLYFADGDGRACDGSQAQTWTWEGGPSWYRVDDRPPLGW